MKASALRLFKALVLFASVRSATPAAAQITVSFYPDTVRLSPDQKGRAFVTLGARGSAVRDLRFEWLTPEGVTTQFEAPMTTRIAANGLLAGSIAVSGQLRSSGDKAWLRVSYLTTEGVRTVAHGTLNLLPRPLPNVNDVLTIEVLTSLASLVDGDSAYVHLLVKNASDYEVTVDSVHALGPAFISFDSIARGLAVPGRGAQLIRVDVHAKDWVRAGKQMLLFRNYVSWQAPQGRVRREVVVSREIDVGVAGESAILQVLALPSFLLLPGFLMVVAFGMVLRQLGTKLGLAAPLTEDPKKAQFWLLAVSLSLLTIFGYPKVGGRNFLRGYGIGDIAWVWFWSVLLGALTAGGVVLVRTMIAWRKGTPNADDDVEKILRKLHRRRLSGISRTRVDVTDGTLNLQGYLLTDGAEGGEAWVAPQAAYKWQGSPDATIRQQFDQALSDGNLQTIANTLRDLKSAGRLNVFWVRRDGFTTPRRVPREKLKVIGDAKLLDEDSNP